MPVNRIVGGIDVERDVAWRAVMCIQKVIDQELVDGFRIHDDLLVSFAGSGISFGEFQPIQCALARQGLAAILGFTLISTVAYVTINLVVDLLYPWLSPQTRG